MITGIHWKIISSQMPGKFSLFAPWRFLKQYKLSALESDMYSELDNQIQVYLNNEISLITEKPVVLLVNLRVALLASRKLISKIILTSKTRLMLIGLSCTLTHTHSNICAGYGGYEIILSLGQYYLLKDIFNGNAQAELGYSLYNGNTYNQNLRRLRARLCELGLEPPVLELTNPPGANPSISSPLTIYLFMHIEE